MDKVPIYITFEDCYYVAAYLFDKQDVQLALDLVNTACEAWHEKELDIPILDYIEICWKSRGIEFDEVKTKHIVGLNVNYGVEYMD